MMKGSVLIFVLIVTAIGLSKAWENPQNGNLPILWRQAICIIPPEDSIKSLPINQSEESSSSEEKSDKLYTQLLSPVIVSNLHIKFVQDTQLSNDSSEELRHKKFYYLQSTSPEMELRGELDGMYFKLTSPNFPENPFSMILSSSIVAKVSMNKQYSGLNMRFCEEESQSEGKSHIDVNQTEVTNHTDDEAKQSETEAQTNEQTQSENQFEKQKSEIEWEDLMTSLEMDGQTITSRVPRTFHRLRWRRRRPSPLLGLLIHRLIHIPGMIERIPPQVIQEISEHPKVMEALVKAAQRDYLKHEQTFLERLLNHKIRLASKANSGYDSFDDQNDNQESMQENGDHFQGTDEISGNSNGSFNENDDIIGGNGETAQANEEFTRRFDETHQIRKTIPRPSHVQKISPLTTKTPIGQNTNVVDVPKVVQYFYDPQSSTFNQRNFDFTGAQDVASQFGAQQEPIQRTSFDLDNNSRQQLNGILYEPAQNLLQTANAVPLPTEQRISGAPLLDLFSRQQNPISNVQHDTVYDSISAIAQLAVPRLLTSSFFDIFQESSKLENLISILDSLPDLVSPALIAITEIADDVFDIPLITETLSPSPSDANTDDSEISETTNDEQMNPSMDSNIVFVEIDNQNDTTLSTENQKLTSDLIKLINPQLQVEIENKEFLEKATKPKANPETTDEINHLINEQIKEDTKIISNTPNAYQMDNTPAAEESLEDGVLTQENITGDIEDPDEDENTEDDA